jgi:predicted nuclease with RNAse H fold
MSVLGIDLAAQPETTGAVLLRSSSAQRWSVTELEGPLDDDALVRAAGTVDVVGVDAPLGWPVAFVEAVTAHGAFEPWPGGVDRSTLTHRDTDRAIRSLGMKPALSVSADRLGSVGMRCALLQRRWAEEAWGSSQPRDGSGRVVETYPAAAFKAWGIDCRGYKDRADAARARRSRESVVESIERSTGALLDLDSVRSKCISSDHILDAVVCALVALAVCVGATHRPTDAQGAAALVEGWIHVPSGLLGDVLS